MKFHGAARLALTVFLLFFRHTAGYPILMPLDGAITGITGYPGLSYQAVRYEPLCGTFGTDSRYEQPIDISEYCDPAIEAYAKNEDTIALYDTTGVRLRDTRVGGGIDVCMCFSLERSDSAKGDFCFYVRGTGQADVWWNLHLEHIIAGNYRPNSGKALPQCGSVDLKSLRAAWSATAFQPSVTEVESTVGNTQTPSLITGYNTVISTKTITPTSRYSGSFLNLCHIFNQLQFQISLSRPRFRRWGQTDCPPPCRQLLLHRCLFGRRQKEEVEKEEGTVAAIKSH
jgi:hypothetical protein